MGLTASRRLTRAAIVLLVVVAAAAAFDALSWWQARGLVEAVERVGDAAAGTDRAVAGFDAGRGADRSPSGSGLALDDDAAPALRLAHAAALAERGEVDAALGLYRRLQADAVVGAAARYNGANLLMRQALAARDSAAPGQALAMIELAKQGYRELLRADPGHWDARYNLERAQRLVPEPDDPDPAIAEPRNDAERAATTMRGVSPGLP